MDKVARQHSYLGLLVRLRQNRIISWSYGRKFWQKIFAPLIIIRYQLLVEVGGIKAIPMQEPFEIRQLRYFLEVADAGSFSRAARRLGVSQPAISQQMRDLEKAVRTTLLQRRGTFLSPDGLLFREDRKSVV